MAMENNRTWVEKGDYSVPNNTPKPLIPLKVKGLLFLLCYFILADIALNVCLSRYYHGRLFTPFPFWGWRAFIAYIAYYGAVPYLKTVSAVLAASFLASAVLFRVWFFDKVESDKEKLATLHGSAHWASKDEIIKAGLMPPDGTPKDKIKIGATLGGWKDQKGVIHYLRHSGPEHLLVVAPTRSGKGISIVVPTLLSWPKSIMVLDIKGENWLLSAGWRQKHIGPCLRFEPTDPNDGCAKYNPLKEIALDTTDETRDIQNIATMICDPDGKHGDDHWISNATTLLTGAITHECYCARNGNREPSMLNVRNTIAGGDIQFSMQNWRDTKHKKNDNGELITHPTVDAVALEMLQKADKEVSSIFSTAITKLSLWLDPVVAKNTTQSTFSISDLVDRDEPVSLYVVVPPSDLTRLRPILRLLVTQIIFGLTKRMEADNEHGGVKSGHKHQLLMLLDEAARLAKLDVLQDGLSYFGSFGLKALLIFQSFKQVSDIYGKDETVTANCKVQVFFAPNEEEDARLISEKLGKTTVTVGSSNISGKRFAVGPFGKSSESISYSQQARELMTPDEVKRLPGPTKDADGRVTAPGDLLLISSGTAPIYGVQTPYFFDPTINDRSKIKPPTELIVMNNPQKTDEHAAGPKEENHEIQPAPSKEIEHQEVESPQTDEQITKDGPETDTPPIDDELLSLVSSPDDIDERADPTTPPEETDTLSPAEIQSKTETAASQRIEPSNNDKPSILDLFYPDEAPSAYGYSGNEQKD